MSLKLVTVHTFAQLLTNLYYSTIFTIFGLFDYQFQSLNEALFRVVKVRQLDGEIESVNQLVGLILDAVGKIHEILVHNESFLAFFGGQGGKALKNLCDMDVVYFVDLDQIFKKHEDQIAEQAGLSAEIRVLEQIENLCN